VRTVPDRSKRSSKNPYVACNLLIAVAAVLIAVVSVAALKQHQLDYIFESPWTGFDTILPHTAWAAFKVWTFWSVAAAILGGIALRVEPRLGLLDATIAGFTGVWIFAYLGGNALGPIGLFRSSTIWALLAVGCVWLWRAPPRIERRRISSGHKLVLLTGVLTMPGLLLVQLGSPVPPYMDIFATPAAAQRIVTFGRYLPFDNDPYGYWNPSSQLPGLELFYALLALGSRSLAVLADTAAIVPMAGLLILTTYRLGKTIAGDTVGGMATLFLCATILFRVLPYMHGRSVSFVLVGAGLAFILDERRNTARLTLGALALATAVASHAIIGTLGMAVASFAVMTGGGVNALAGVGLMAGASLVALPTIHVGLQIPVYYPLLPLEQVLGVALIAVAARRLNASAVTDRLRWLRWGFTVLAVAALLWHPYPLLLGNHPLRFPLLVYGGGLGLGLMLLMDRRPSRALLGPVTFALLLGMAVEYVSNRWHVMLTDPGVRVAMYNWFHKVGDWYPYILVFPTAYLAAWLSRTVSRRAAMLVVLAFLFFPWRDRLDPSLGPAGQTADPNYHQHSISEAWAYQMETGKRGHWGNTRDRRWAQSPAELELAEVLRGEVAAGRITPATHVVHLSAFVSLYQDVLLFSVYTGINDDPYLTNHVFNPSDAGSRLRPIEEVHARLAERPPYVVIHNEPSVQLAPEALHGYEEIFNRDGVRLLREASVR